jgi:hypothetical protein
MAQQRRLRTGYESVSSLIPQALNLSPFRDAPSKQSLPLEPSMCFKSFFDKSLGSCAKICRTGRLFAVRFAQGWGEIACNAKGRKRPQMKYIIKNNILPETSRDVGTLKT